MKHSSSLLAGLAMLIALTIVSIPAAATRYYVKADGTATSGTGSWGDAYGDLQLAIDNASAGDSIVVAAGTYHPMRRADNGILSPNDRDNAFVLKEDVKIYGGFAGNDDDEPVDQRDWKTNTTILNGSNRAYHVVISADSVGAALLDGVTISGGNASGSSTINVNGKAVSRDCGGGMYNSSSSPTLTNVTISGNSANNNGGGMYNVSSSLPTLTNVTISGNSAGNDGGGMYNTSSSPTLTNVTISGNSANHNGGGMYNNSSSPMLTYVTISGNTAHEGCGMFNYDNSSPTLTNVTISGNSTDSGSGGGMYNSSSSSPTLTNVTISGNQAFTCGGMYNSVSSPKLTNVTISGNQAVFTSGGMYNNNSSPKLTNVTISGNTANVGGGMYNYFSSSPTIQNSIIWGNSSGVHNNDHNAIPVYTYSLVQGLNPPGEGNLNGNAAANDPRFVNQLPAGSSTGGDYRLKEGSPAIDAGNNADNTTTKDLAGNPRRFGPIDMGAYENQDNYYTVIMPDGDVTGISSINITVDENDYLQFLPGKYHVHSGSNFTFTLTYATGYDEKPANVANNGDALLPNDAGTYTVSDEAVVTITGVANGDTEEDNGDGDEDGDGNDGSDDNGNGDGNDGSDGSDDNDNDYNGIGLVITDGTTTIIERIFINDIEVPFDTTAAVNYTVACGTGDPLSFLLTTKASGPALITMPPLDTAFDFTPKPGLNHIPVNIFAINGTVSHKYDFVIAKLFEYDSLIDQKWNNTLLVRRNPNNNGGYTFVDYEWFCNNTSIGTEGFYSAGNKRTDLLDFDALYHAEMRTNDGQKLQTCPGKPIRTAVAASLRVYPNPVRRGNITHIQSGSNSEQLLNLAEPTEVSIYNSMGKFVKVQKLTAPLTEFVLDVTPGIYFIHLKEQQVKVVVD